MNQLIALWAQPLAASLLDAGLALLLADQWLQRLPLLWRRCLQYSIGVAWLLYLVIASQNMTQSAWSALPSVLPLVLLHTHFGWTQCLALLAWVVLCGTQPRTYAHWFGLVGLLLSRAATGHAAQNGFVSWALPIQLVHLSAASLWLGSVVLGSLQRPAAHQQAAQLAQRLSQMATWSLGLIVATGCWNAAQRLPTPIWPNDSLYMRWLGCKLLLVASAVVLGVVNRCGFLPAAQQQHPQALQHFWRVLRLEAGLLLLVLVLASQLATTMPS